MVRGIKTITWAGEGYFPIYSGPTPDALWPSGLLLLHWVNAHNNCYGLFV